MLKRDIRKGVSSPGSREIGQGPSLGKVSRSPRSGIQSSHIHSSQGKREKRQRIIKAWSLALSAISALILIAAIVIYMRFETKSSGSSQFIPPSAIQLDSAFADQTAVKVEPPGEDFTLKAIKSCLQDQNPQLIAKHFHLPEGVTPDSALETLNQLVEIDGEIVEFNWLGTRFSNNRFLEQVAVFMTGISRPTDRLAQFFLDQDGNWKIDFDSYIRRTNPDWETIIAGDSPTSIVRTFINADTYYNSIYSDDRIWQSYILASPDIEEILYSYVKIGTPQHRALEKILSEGEDIQRITLEITKNPESADRQFEITRVLAEDWVFYGEAYDKSL